MGVAILAPALALLLFLHIPGGNCQSCYPTTNCTGNAISVQNDVRGCCVDTNDGLSWGSPESCQVCNVHGFEQRYYTITEEENAVLISTFKINAKGNGRTVGISPLFQRGRLETAVGSAATTDFESFNNIMTANILQNDVDWSLTVINDQIALEFDETLEVIFNPVISTGPAIINQLENGGTFIRSTATITIVDNDDLEINFDVRDYNTREDAINGLSDISLSFRETAIDFEILFIPTTLDDSLATYNLSDFLGADVVNATDNQKAKPGEDFNDTAFTETITAGSTDYMLRPLGYVNDNINERLETFILVAKVVGRAAQTTCFQQTQGGSCFPIGAARILLRDDDLMWIGFRNKSITVLESQNGIVDSFPIFVNIHSLRTSEVEYLITVNLMSQRTATVVARGNNDGQWDAAFGNILPGQNRPFEEFPLEPEHITIRPINVEIRNDFRPEDTENFGLRLTSADIDRRIFQCYEENEIPTEGPYFCTIQVVIEDDDEPFVISFVETVYRASESEGYVEVCAELVEPSYDILDNVIGPDVFVNDSSIYIPNGAKLAKMALLDLEEEDDFQFSSGITVNIEEERREVCYNQTFVDDERLESSEWIGLHLDILPMPPFGPTTVLTLVRIDNTAIEIIDDDVARVGFENTFYRVSENAGVVEICAVVFEPSITCPIEFPFDVTFQSRPDSAVSPMDYEDLNTTLTFNACQTRVCTNVTIVNDDVAESTESFFVSLERPGGLDPRITLDPNVTEVEIIDSDQAIVGLEMTFYRFTEDVGLQEICAIVYSPVGSCPIGFAFNVDLETNPGTAVSPMDYGAVSTTLSFDACAQKVCINVMIVDDDAPEGMEHFVARLVRPADLDSSITLNPVRAELQILDNDDVEIGWERTVYYANETFGRVEVCGIVYNMMLSRSVTVRVETSDGTAMETVNYQPVNMTLGPFSQPGERICLDIEIPDNLLCNNDPNLNFTVVMSRLSPDDDVMIDVPATTVVIDDSREPECEPITVGYEFTFYTTSEEEGSVEICAVIYEPATGGAPRSFVVSASTEDGTATSGDDYVAVSQQLTFSVGDTKQCYNVTINDDNECENNPSESFSVNLEYFSGTMPTIAPNRADVVINDAGQIECVVVYVNDTIVGDPLFHVPIKSSNSPLKDVGLCYEIHGEKGYYFNLVSDSCTSVNAHWIDVTSTLNVIDEVAIRTVDDNNNCKNINISLGECSASVDGASVASFKSGGISLEKTRSNRWQIIVPNCHSVRLEMWVTCEHNTLTNPGTDTTIEADMIKFVVERGLNVGRLAHGLIGQFWNREVSVKDYTGPRHSSVADLNHYTVTMPQGRNFTAIHHNVNWIWERVNCLYAGNHQGGPIYEVADPNDPVIAGNYTNYIVPGPFSEEGYKHKLFDTSKCN